jgi:hypothetical protein
MNKKISCKTDPDKNEKNFVYDGSNMYFFCGGDEIIVGKNG